MAVQVAGRYLLSSGSATSPKAPPIGPASGILFHFRSNTALGRLSLLSDPALSPNYLSAREHIINLVHDRSGFATTSF